MIQMQVALRGLPLVAVFIAPGKCAVVPRARFGAILEVNPGKAYAHLFDDGFVVFNGPGFEAYEYNVAYDLHLYPNLKQWLVEMKLQTP